MALESNVESVCYRRNHLFWGVNVLTTSVAQWFALWAVDVLRYIPDRTNFSKLVHIIIKSIVFRTDNVLRHLCVCYFLDNIDKLKLFFYL